MPDCYEGWDDRDHTIPAEASAAPKSRLKGGYSQDWLPHKDRNQGGDGVRWGFTEATKRKSDEREESPWQAANSGDCADPEIP